MPATDPAPIFAVNKPYPGLRSFEAHEAFLFHGRQEHTRALLERLTTDRFLAVVGSSGSGKSSLVRAGLLPALYRGYLVGASSRWRIAVMRPGNAPLAELAAALSGPSVLGVGAAVLRETIGRTSLGLTTVVSQAHLAEGENVLLVVDQFEELFRFEKERRHLDGGAEASLFVQSLIEAGDAYHGRLYVVLTMRSDYLGQCARFAGLPEALNRGQYLIPHLTREQRLEAIEKPPLLVNVRIKPALVQHLLNDLGDDPAQLPVLQHALMRTFERLKESDGHELDFRHYQEAGGISHALDQHANNIVDGLAERSRAWVEKLFRCLTTLEGGRAVRRPARLDRIYQVLGVSGDESARHDVNDVIRAFAQHDNSLLISSTGAELTPDSVIDISHESLIRNWQRLKDWLTEETRSAEWFRSLADDTARHRAGEASLWRDPELTRALKLKATGGWNDAWARQYLPQADPSFTEVERFLEESVESQQRERDEKEARRRKEIEDAQALAQAAARTRKAYGLLSAALVALLIAALGGGYWWWSQHQREERLRREQRARDQENAQLQLALTEKINSAAAAQDALARQLQEAQEQLKASSASGADAAALRTQVAQLQARVAQSSAAQNNAKQQLEQASSKPYSSGTEYASAVKQITDLQDELKKTREERDALQSRINAASGTVPSKRPREGSYVRPQTSAPP